MTEISQFYVTEVAFNPFFTKKGSAITRQEHFARNY